MKPLFILLIALWCATLPQIASSRHASGTRAQVEETPVTDDGGAPRQHHHQRPPALQHHQRRVVLRPLRDFGILHFHIPGTISNGTHSSLVIAHIYLRLLHASAHDATAQRLLLLGRQQQRQQQQQQRGGGGSSAKQPHAASDTATSTSGGGDDGDSDGVQGSIVGRGFAKLEVLEAAGGNLTMHYVHAANPGILTAASEVIAAAEQQAAAARAAAAAAAAAAAGAAAEGGAGQGGEEAAVVVEATLPAVPFALSLRAADGSLVAPIVVEASGETWLPRPLDLALLATPAQLGAAAVLSVEGWPRGAALGDVLGRHVGPPPLNPSSTLGRGPDDSGDGESGGDSIFGGAGGIGSDGSDGGGRAGAAAAARALVVLPPVFGWVGSGTAAALLDAHVRWHRAMGFGGHVVYATAPGALLGQPSLARHFAAGTLRLMAWDAQASGLPTVVQEPYYNQIHVNNHALLAFWGSATWLLLTDLDEFFATLRPTTIAQLLFGGSRPSADDGDGGQAEAVDGSFAEGGGQQQDSGCLAGIRDHVFLHRRDAACGECLRQGKPELRKWLPSPDVPDGSGDGDGDGGGGRGGGGAGGAGGGVGSGGGGPQAGLRSLDRLANYTDYFKALINPDRVRFFGVHQGFAFGQDLRSGFADAGLDLHPSSDHHDNNNGDTSTLPTSDAGGGDDGGDGGGDGGGSRSGGSRGGGRDRCAAFIVHARFLLASSPRFLQGREGLDGNFLGGTDATAWQWPLAQLGDQTK